MYSQMLCLNNWDVFHNPAEKDCSLGRRCGGDCEIFLESGWAAGGNANTMFALAGKRHGWQRKGGPVMMRSTSPLSFRKSTVVASIWVQGGQSFLRGFYGPLRYEPCTQFINVSQRTLHIYFIDGCRVCPLDAQYIVKNKNSDLWASSQIAVSVLTMHGS